MKGFSWKIAIQQWVLGALSGACAVYVAGGDLSAVWKGAATGFVGAAAADINSFRRYLNGESQTAPPLE